MGSPQVHRKYTKGAEREKKKKKKLTMTTLPEQKLTWTNNPLPSKI